jgi:hypothetical protein
MTISNFVRLRQISAANLSFKSGATLQRRLEELPETHMQWMATDIKPRSRKLSSTITLYHRNPLDCIRSLLNRPSLKDHLDYVPKRVYTDAMRQQRLYSEVMTGDWAWRMQVGTFTLC